jgi:4-amino-4-deoxy-L-arabinose transferase-like glycosyltransferase
LLAFVLVVALALRLVRLDSGLWYDEIATLTDFVQLPFAQLICTYTDQNQHPLYSLLARAAVLTLGESAWALRLPAVLFGIAGLWVFYYLARELVPPAESLLATACLAVSYHHVWFSQNARGYTGLLFWVLAGAYFFVRGLKRSRPGSWLAYAVVMALGTYTHFTALFVLAGHGIIWLCRLVPKIWRQRTPSLPDVAPLGAMLLSLVGAGLLYAPLLPQVVASVVTLAREPKVVPWCQPGWGASQLGGGMSTAFGGVLGAALAGGLFLIGAASHWRGNRLVLGLFLLPCAIGVLAVWTLNRPFYPRFLFVGLPVLFLCLVRGARVIEQCIVSRFNSGPVGIALRGVVPVLVSATVLVGCGASVAECYRIPKQDFAGALAYVQQARAAGESVATVGMAAVCIGRHYGVGVGGLLVVRQPEELAKGADGHAEWLIYTFAEQLAAVNPLLWAAVQERYSPERVFPGTVAGGEVYVCRRKHPDGKGQNPR